MALKTCPCIVCVEPVVCMVSAQLRQNSHAFTCTLGVQHYPRTVRCLYEGWRDVEQLSKGISQPQHPAQSPSYRLCPRLERLQMDVGLVCMYVYRIVVCKTQRISIAQSTVPSWPTISTFWRHTSVDKHKILIQLALKLVRKWRHWLQFVTVVSTEQTSYHRLPNWVNVLWVDTRVSRHQLACRVISSRVGAEML